MPLDPITQAALIKGGADILGGLLGNERPTGPNSKQIRRNLLYNERMLNEVQIPAQKKIQDEITIPGISKSIGAQVKGAKDAGLHPLFALGGAISGGSPALSIGNISNTQSEYGAGDAVRDLGQSVADIYRGRKTAVEKEIEDLQLRQARAQVGITEQQYLQSVAATDRQSNVITKPLPDLPPLQMHRSEGVPTYQENVPAPNMFVTQPDVVKSRRSEQNYVTTGTHAGFKEFNMGGFRLMLLDNEEGPSESMEALWNPAVLAATINANYQAYGKPGVNRLLDFIKRKQGQVRIEYERRSSKGYRKKPYYK